MASLDIAWIRAQFPAIAQEINNQPVIFFDGLGGTQVPQQVIDAMSDYLTRSNANTHGAFATSVRTDEVIRSAHEAMADLLYGLPDIRHSNFPQTWANVASSPGTAIIMPKT